MAQGRREFAEKAKDVIDFVCDAVESSLVDRAVNGVPRGVYYKGERIGENREYDTRAAEFSLRGRTKLRRYWNRIRPPRVPHRCSP
jgi:hypothetical protein